MPMRTPIRSTRLLATIAALALPVTAASAQICTGMASFASGPVRIGAGVTFGDHFKAYSGQLAFGTPAAGYGSFTVSRDEYEGAEDAGAEMALVGGYQFSATPDKTVVFCPEVGFTYVRIPTVDTGFGIIEGTGHAFGFGGSVGRMATTSPTFSFVPFVGTHFFESRVTATFQGGETSSSDTYGVVDAGAGFVLNKTFTIQPSVAVPVGVEGGKASFFIGFGINFGQPSRP